MTIVLYLLIAALVFMIIGYLLAKVGCTPGERYVSQTPIDPVTEDNGGCEDSEILALQKSHEESVEVEAQSIQEEAEKEEDAKKEAAEKINAEAEAAKRKTEEEASVKKAAAEKEKIEKAAIEKAASEKAAAQAQAESEEKAEAEEASADASAPEGLLDAPRNGKKDNLTRIKGIGVKIDQALNGIGIWHLDQIAVWTEENMAWADRELAFPGRAKRDDWVGQAKLLAEGKETEFSKRVDKGEVASSKKV